MRRAFKAFRRNSKDVSPEVDHEKARQQMLDACLEDLHARLEGQMKNSGSIGESFISRGSLQDIWSEAYLELFLKLVAPGIDKALIPDFRQRYIQTLSILVWIRWDDWSRFESIFFRQNLADCDIRKYILDDLKDPSFLGPQWASHFFNDRYLFCPIDILEGQNIIQPTGWRLPFLHSSEEIRLGGFSEVAKIRIARGHFYPLSGCVNGEPSNDDFEVACKSFTARRGFLKELKNLTLLRDSLSQSTRIVLSLATVTIEPQFNIIFPWADMDLDKFLAGSHREFPKLTLRALIDEASMLAGALSFLHDGLQPPELKCCHMDLKPPNILIFASDGYPAGEWKIADFGISIIDKPDQHPQTVSDLVHNITFPVQDELKYHTSTYQPPEASTRSPFGRRSDVWSLGCILMRVLAFGLGGEQELQKLDYQRGLDDEGLLNSRDDKFYRGTPPRLNPHVGEWLNTLLDRYPEYNRRFLERCRDLLFGMFSIDKEARPLSIRVYQELRDISNSATPERNQAPASDGPVMTAPSVNNITATMDSLVEAIKERKSRENSLSESSLAPACDSSVATTLSQADNDITATVESLVTAIKKGSIGEIRVLLNGKVMVEETHGDDRPVIHAIRCNFPEAVRMLQVYKSELDLETPDSHGSTPLRLAVDTGKPDLVEALLGAGVNINAPSVGGLTPLMAAAKRGNVPIITRLLDLKADYTACSVKGLTCLHYAATNMSAGPQAIRAFIGRVETVDIPSSGGGPTPLFMLVNSYTDTPLWWEKFRALLTGNPDVNRTDRNNITPLAVAVQKNKPLLAEKLLELGALYGTASLPRRDGPVMKEVMKKIRAQREPENNGSIFSLRRSSLASSLARS